MGTRTLVHMEHPSTDTPPLTERCFDCDDHGHLSDEHCWWEGDVCTCGDKPLWTSQPAAPCPSENRVSKESAA